MKVNKEEMLGMLVALDLYVKKNHEQERREFDRRAEMIQKSATEVPGVWVAGNVADLRSQVITSAAAGLTAGATINADLISEETRLAVAARSS